MKRSFRTLGLVYFILGIFLLMNSKLNITGAIIGSQNVFSSFNLILGIVLILVSSIIFASASRLEESLSDVAEIESELAAPVIIDTNYLIDVCKNPSEYKSLMKFIKERHEKGQLTIVPRSVYNEFKSYGDEGEKNRIKNLKEALPIYTKLLEDIEVNASTNLNEKIKSTNIAEKILHQTPKYFAYKYLSEIDRGENITVDRFIGKSRGRMSNALMESKYEENLQNARREYDKINYKAGAKGKKNFLSTYDISNADIDVLTGALLLKDVPNLLGNKSSGKIGIITRDSHLIDSSVIFNRTHPGDNRINVRDRI